jgi:hypothetical protein
MKTSIVIAHYKENLDWINNISNDITVYLYTKGGVELNIKKENIHIFDLPNIGNEQHTYFYHVINYYNNLEDIIFFVQGNPYEHSIYFDDKLNNRFLGGLSDFNLITSLYGDVDINIYKKHINHKYENIVYDQINNNIFIDPWNDSDAELNINYIIDNLPELKIKKENWIFNANGMYSTTKDKILELDINTYEKCLEFFNVKDLNMVEYAFERINNFILLR